MISTTSLAAFSTGVGAAHPAQRPHPPPGVQEARTQPKQQVPLQAQPDKRWGTAISARPTSMSAYQP